MPRFHLLALISLFLLCSNSIYSLEKNIIEGEWKFQHGDSPTWSQTDFNDTKWAAIQVPSLIKQRHNISIIGWYRIHFNANVDVNESQALLIEYLRHSDETWINGIRVGGEGKFEKRWQFNETNPQGLTRVYAIPAGFLKDKNNLLAIKVSIGFGDALGAMYPGGAGIVLGNVYLGDIKEFNEYKRSSEITTASIDTFFMTLGIVELFIILFLLKQAINTFPEYKWLFFTSLVMLLGSLGHDVFYIQGWTSIRLNLLLVAALLTMPLSVALYFWAQYKNISLTTVRWVIGFWLLPTTLIFVPSVSNDIKVISWYSWLGFTAVFFLYSFYCALKGVLSARIGATIQLIAVTVYILSIPTQWLPDNLLGHRNVQIGSLFYRYALLFAYFQQIRSMKLDHISLSKRVIKVAENIYVNLARELHDGIGQHLASMKLQTKLAQVGSTNKHIENVHNELKASVIELRHLLTGLHPMLIDKYDICEAIKHESHHLEKVYKITISLNLDESIELNKSSEHQIFRIFQECTNNATKHSHASEIAIHLSIKGTNWVLRILDNGCGFDVSQKRKPNESGGLGLVSLHERIALLNGHVNIKSNNKGTQIYISASL